MNCMTTQSCVGKISAKIKKQRDNMEAFARGAKKTPSRPRNMRIQRGIKASSNIITQTVSCKKLFIQ